MVDNNIPIQRYFRSGQEMIRMASIYCDEKQYESAYILLAKFITLFLEKLKSHTQYKLATAQAKAANKVSVKLALSKAEEVKSILEEQYQLEYVKWVKEQEMLRLLEEERLEQEILKERHRKNMEAKAMLDQEKMQMDYFEEQQRRKELEKERLNVEAEFKRPANSQNKGSASLIPVDFAPPPDLCFDDNSSAKEYSSGSITTSVLPPTVDRSTKPSDSTKAALKMRNNKYGLRTVVSPEGLPQIFKKYAKSNTDRNVETCGVLFGNLSQNQFIITHILLPHQSGTSESCNTTREEDMWEFQEFCNGICLGWIHTHPSQTAFLSSVDLHTHYPYQCLIGESVAIVCSGKFNETGYFMISPGTGMNEIGSCSKTGHHPHTTNPPLFEACDHVQVSSAHTVELVDWRCK